MPPFIILGCVLGILYGVVFYLVFGHGWLRLIFYSLVSIGSFFVGHWVASVLGLALFNIGELRVIEGTVASWLALVTLRVWRRA